MIPEEEVMIKESFQFFSPCVAKGGEGDGGIIR
jgi:hypothetical protein